MTQKPTDKEQRAFSSGQSIRGFLSSPVLNGWGFLVGLIGIVFAIYTWWDARSFPLLTAQVNSIRTILVSPEGIENLQISAKGKPIKGPVTAAQIAIWNAGKHPIRAEDVLEPIKIHIQGNVPILSTRILRTTRDAIGFGIDESNAPVGTLTARFRILEEGDGVLLQVTYMGSDGLPFRGTGVIVGQRVFEIPTTPSLTTRRSTATQTPSWLGKLIMLTMMGVMCFVLITVSRGGVRRFRNILPRARELLQLGMSKYKVIGLVVLYVISDVIMAAATVFVLVYFAMDLVTQRSPPLPFQ